MNVESFNRVKVAKLGLLIIAILSKAQECRAIDDMQDLSEDPYQPNDQQRISMFEPPDCSNFVDYVVLCAVEAIEIYNVTRMAPPRGEMIYAWCRSIKHLAHCSTEWNKECGNSVDDHYNEDSIRGHLHVTTNICNDEAFMEKYTQNTICLSKVERDWEICYMDFKANVEEQKNGTVPWTHFEAHFFLCCARAEFHRCAFDVIYAACEPHEASILQRFTVIISQGEVLQNCERGVVYENCPGGDPRPIVKTQTQRNMDLSRFSSHDPVRSSSDHVFDPTMSVSPIRDDYKFKDMLAADADKGEFDANFSIRPIADFVCFNVVYPLLLIYVYLIYH